MNKDKKIINFGSLIIKGIAIIFFILAFTAPWSNLTLSGPLVFIIGLIYIISIILTYVGIIKTKLSETLEPLGIIGQLLLVIGYGYIVLLTLLLNPSRNIVFQLGYVFVLIGLAIITIDFFILRKRFDRYFRKRALKKARREGKTEEEEKEKAEKDDSEGFFSKLRKKFSRSEGAQKVAKKAGKKAAEEVGEELGDFAREKAEEVTEDEDIRELTEKAVSRGVEYAGKKGVEKMIESQQEKEEEQKKAEKESEEKQKVRSQKDKSAKTLTPYSIPIKVITLIFGIISMVFPWTNLDFTEFEGLGLILTMFFIIYIIGLFTTLLGVIKSKSGKTFELLGLFIANTSLAMFLVLSLMTILGNPSEDITFEAGYYIALITLIIISIEVCIKAYFDKKEEKERIKKKRKEEGRLLKFSDRVKTRANFPERWAMIHGKESKEEEDFLHFKELKVKKSLSKTHPNYLHLKIKNLLEKLGYRIEKSQRPLNTENYDFDFYELYGTVKGHIKTEVKGRMNLLNIFALGLGFILLLCSVVLLFTNAVEIIYSFTLIIISLLFIVIFLVRFIIQSLPGLKGYTNIYVLEQGNAWYGRESSHKEEASRDKSLESPSLGFNEIISLATAVKSMSVEDAKQDLNKLYNKISEF